jgi:hypothetical protein
MHVTTRDLHSPYRHAKQLNHNDHREGGVSVNCSSIYVAAASLVVRAVMKSKVRALCMELAAAWAAPPKRI